MTHTEQPGQPTPLDKLNAIQRATIDLLAEIAHWTDRHRSVEMPFANATVQMEYAALRVGAALHSMEMAAAELMTENKSC